MPPRHPARPRPSEGPGRLVHPVRRPERHHLPAGTQYGDHIGGTPYGSAPLELTATRVTVLLLMTGFIAACLVQLAGGVLLILLRPSGFVVLPAGMLLSAVFWWGFDLPLAWLSTAMDIPVLAAAWLVYRRASRKLPAAAPPPQPSRSG